MIGEIEEMPVEELFEWVAFFELTGPQGANNDGKNKSS
jgi:hypothetical protein